MQSLVNTIPTDSLFSNEEELYEIPKVYSSIKDMQRNKTLQRIKLNKSQTNDAPKDSIEYYKQELEKEKASHVETLLLLQKMKNEIKNLKETKELATPSDSSQETIVEQLQDQVNDLYDYIDELEFKQEALILENRNLTTELEEKNAEIDYLEQELETTKLSFDPNVCSYPKNEKPRTPIKLLCPAKYNHQIWEIFVKNDTTESGKLDIGELKSAISQGKWPALSLLTCKYLARHITKGGDSVNPEQFLEIWRFVSICKAVFSRHDSLRNSNTEWGHVPSYSLMEVFEELEIPISRAVLDTAVKNFRAPDHLFTWDEFIQFISMVRMWNMELKNMKINPHHVEHFMSVLSCSL
ncbi:peflin or Penta-EF hand domain-containing protein 1 [Boothiomyces macroporosus]|uniref:Peflin or Penta-EF hand domain-containing protein 1 n=1 Tax=Boothiomyces macroporosus TaxID=261099 RepID=A0AAD5UFZ4_9FUNG|nr:peflin or Penta-EF hand domain-containing protein 1 [Boothiomyces macroporosus]